MKDTCKAFHTFHDQMLLSIHVLISYWFVQIKKKVLQTRLHILTSATKITKGVMRKACRVSDT